MGRERSPGPDGIFALGTGGKRERREYPADAEDTGWTTVGSLCCVDEAGSCVLQEKKVSPTKEVQVVKPDIGFYWPDPGDSGGDSAEIWRAFPRGRMGR